MNCEECTNIPAKLICCECDQALCPRCDEAIHRGGKRKTHSRQVICHNCRTLALHLCNTCQTSFCNSCRGLHSDHNLTAILPACKIAVFWDLNSCRPLKPEDVQTAVMTLKEKFEKIDFIKAYGEMFHK